MKILILNYIVDHVFPTEKEADMQSTFSYYLYAKGLATLLEDVSSFYGLDVRTDEILDEEGGAKLTVVIKYKIDDVKKADDIIVSTTKALNHFFQPYYGTAGRQLLARDTAVGRHLLLKEMRLMSEEDYKASLVKGFLK